MDRRVVRRAVHAQGVPLTCRDERVVVSWAVQGLRAPDLRRASPRIPAATTEQRNSKEAVMAETWSGEFYCVKCKEKREAEGEVKVNDKGTRMAKAVCPVCGTNLNRILGKA
jgi:hypothetical protein